MFLKSLKIQKDDDTIREVTFKKGINLIVDETSTKDKKESGNNVGKTTVLRLIDFCLGGDGKNIYTDTEFKRTSSNSLIESFLKDKKIIITLTLVDDLGDPSANSITVRKNFLLRGQKIQEINGKNYNDEEFDKEMKRLIFRSMGEKPTFKQIISKNIRDEKNRLTNTIRVLDPYSRIEEYELLYLFWLGIDVSTASEKAVLQQQKNLEERLQKRMKQENGALDQIEQSLTVIDRVILDLEEKKKDFGSNEDFNQELIELNNLKSEINILASQVSALEMRKDLIIESKKELETDLANIDMDKIRTVYDKAKKYIPNLHSTFEQTLSFHNEMIKEKIDFITQELPETESEIKISRSKLDDLLKKESGLSKKILKSKTLDEMEKINRELNESFEKKGELGEQKKNWDKSNEMLKSINTSLETINETINEKDDLIKERIEEFNKYFSEMSYRLYGERFVLSSEKTERAYELNITSIEGNLGTGKKKGQIAAFDFAYIQFADALRIPCLHFVLHDQIENIHDNQIDNLITEVITDVNCQYIVPVLRDKLPANIDVSKYEVLFLSQDDKLFKIE